MKKRGRYEKIKPAGSAWKKVLIVILCVLLLIALLLTAGYFFLESKFKIVKQAEFVDKGTTAELDKMAGSPDTMPETTEPLTEETEATEEPTEIETEPVTEETTVPTEPTEPDWGESGKKVNIMVIGQDFRDDEAHKLSDTMMLFTLNKENKTLTVTSFLRDSYVNLPDYYRGHTCGWNRINTSYALGYGWFGDAGAMDMLNTTIKGNFGIEIDGDVEVGLDSFAEIIDMIGEVTVSLDEDETNYMNEQVDAWQNAWAAANREPVWDLHHMAVGENHMNGREALIYARMRHATPADSDINRANRQRLLVESVLKKLKTMNLLELNALVDKILSAIVTNISVDDMKMYVMELLPYVFDIELVSNQCPADGTYWGEMVELPDGVAGVLKMDFNQNAKLLQEICED